MSGPLHSFSPVIVDTNQKIAPTKEHCEHQADCLKKIQAILDGGATEEEKNHFRQNMDTCMPCIRMYHLEKCIKEALHGKIEKKCCPEKVAAAIQAQVTQ